MAVLLADRSLTVRAKTHPWARDARGVPMPAAEPVVEERGPHPGAAVEQADLSWALRLDPAVWPLRAGDEVTDGTLTWVVAGEPKLHQVPGVTAVDHIEATGQLDPPRVP